VLATTELEKVPETIQSRCQVFTFKKPTTKAIAEMVTRVAKAEGFTLEKSSAELIALLSAGSFRDAQSVLQKILVSSSDKKVNVEEVEMITGAPKGELVRRVLEALAKGEANDALAAVGEAVEANADMEIFTMLLLDRARLALLLRYSADFVIGLVADVPEADKEVIETLAKDTNSKLNSETLKKLIEAAIAIPRSPVPQLPLELAIMELCA